MASDTNLGGEQFAFPETHLSAMLVQPDASPAARAAAAERLAAAYWKPVYKHIRRRWNANSEDARDLTQGFFVDALERELFARYDPRRAAFRTYVRTCVDGFVSNQRTAGRREKRGGGRLHFSLDFDAAEAELRLADGGDADADAAYEQEWVRLVFARAVDALRARCRADGREQLARVFERYDLHDEQSGPRPTYAAIAAEAGVPATTITNDLAAARRLFRACVLASLRDLTGSEEEYHTEVRRLLGGAPP